MQPMIDNGKRPRENFYSCSEAANATGMSKGEMLNEPGFPRVVRRGMRIVGWYKEDIDRWVARNGKR